jgi:beta-phosphoglucomutase
MGMDAFLFDLDGLLVDSEPMHYAAFTNTAKSFGYTVPWDFRTYCHKAHTQSLGLKKAFLELFPEAESVWHDLYHTVKLNFSKLIEMSPLELMPGVNEFLDLILTHNKKFAVVTNSSTPMVLAIMAKQPLLKKIPLWITREDYENAKPLPDGYLKALHILGVSSDKACGFEDSPRGVKSLKAADVLAFHISPFSIGETGHYETIENLMQNQEVMSKLFEA